MYTVKFIQLHGSSLFCLFGNSKSKNMLCSTVKVQFFKKLSYLAVHRDFEKINPFEMSGLIRCSQCKKPYFASVGTAKNVLACWSSIISPCFWIFLDGVGVRLFIAYLLWVDGRCLNYEDFLCSHSKPFLVKSHCTKTGAWSERAGSLQLREFIFHSAKSPRISFIAIRSSDLMF